MDDPQSQPDASPEVTPKTLRSMAGDVTPEDAVRAAAAIEDAKACEAELTQRGVAFKIGPSISEGMCGVLRPIEIERLSSGITVEPATKILCRTALALDIWASDVIVPAAKTSFPRTSVDRIRQVSTYVCRSRASESKISEHARGSAIDIGSLRLVSGREIKVVGREGESAMARFQHAVREGACGPFKTVLGPGTDADHDTHFHLDLAARRGGATYCR